MNASEGDTIFIEEIEVLADDTHSDIPIDGSSFKELFINSSS